MSEIELVFSNNIKKKYPEHMSYYDISLNEPNAKDIVGVSINNKVCSLGDIAESGAHVEFLTASTANGSRIYAAGMKMLFEFSVKRLYKNAHVEFLYYLPRGVVARISNKTIKEEDIDKIFTEMKNVVNSNYPIEKLIVKNDEAIKYYDSVNNSIKSKNIQNIIGPTVVLYRMDDLVNYYYSEMPYSMGVLKNFSLSFLGNNMIHIMYPNEYDKNGKVKIYDYSTIIDMYKESKNWLNTMNASYIPQINKMIESGNINNFIRSSEINFNMELNDMVKYICRNKDIKFVMISGPSSSGKTTVAKRVANYFEVYGKKPTIISIDDYYKERVDCPKDEKGDYDFECLDALDLKYLASDFKNFLNGKEVMLPKFNFYTGKKETSGKKIKLEEDSIVIFEGLHAINDDLLPSIPNNLKYKIYACPFFSVSLDSDNDISSVDLRLLRRIVRDFRTRGYNIESTIKNNLKVRNGEEKWIIPCIPNADKILNTALPYELGVLKVMVEPLLYSVPVSSDFYNEARRLLSVLKQLFTINSECIPVDSILREFIGGGLND